MTDPLTLSVIKADVGGFPGHTKVHPDLLSTAETEALSDKRNWPEKNAGLRCSGRELTPIGQGGSAVLFEDIASVKVAVLVEVVVD